MNGRVTEEAAKSLALQLAQVHLDKALADARMSLLLGRVRDLIETTQWVPDDNGVMSPVVAAQPMQALQTLVLNPD